MIRIEKKRREESRSEAEKKCCWIFSLPVLVFFALCGPTTSTAMLVSEEIYVAAAIFQWLHDNFLLIGMERAWQGGNCRATFGLYYVLISDALSVVLRSRQAQFDLRYFY